MNSMIKILAVLLVCQLTLWFFLQSSGSGQVEETPALLEAAVVEGSGLSLEIDDAQGNTATLKKLDDGWQLASGLPADASKADGLLAKLKGLSLGWPASTNADSHERFEVADDAFQRKVQIVSDAGSATLYFGTSPGYQQVHVRATGDSVFAVKVANHEMPALADDWVDKSLLKSNGVVSSVTWENDLVVTKQPGGWMLGGEVSDAQATEAAVNRVANVQVLGVLETAPTAPPTEAREILVSDSSGDYRLSFWAREPTNDHVIVSTRYPGEAFRMANFTAEQLVPEVDGLMPPPTTAPPELNFEPSQ